MSYRHCRAVPLLDHYLDLCWDTWPNEPLWRLLVTLFVVQHARTDRSLDDDRPFYIMPQMVGHLFFFLDKELEEETHSPQIGLIQYSGRKRRGSDIRTGIL